MTDLHQHLRERVLAAVAELGLDREQVDGLVRLDPPKNRDHGDVALGAFQLAKLAKQPPPAFAAALALERDCAVQDVPYDALRARLLGAGQVLEWAPGDGVGAGR